MTISASVWPIDSLTSAWRSFQALESLVGDLHLLEKKTFFWNWSREAIGVMHRTNAKVAELFKEARTEDELLKLLNSHGNAIDSTATAQTDVAPSIQNLL